MERSGPTHSPFGDAGIQEGTIENAVYKLALDILSETKKPLNLNILFSQCLSRLHLSPNQANSTIATLIKKRMIIEGTKLTRGHVLRNKTRQKIFNHVRKSPGTYVRDIRRTLNIGSSEAKWHLSMLEKFGFIRKKVLGKYVAYYPAELTETFDEILCMLHVDSSYRVFYDCFVNPEATLDEIARRVEIHPQTAKYHIDRFITSGLIINSANRYSVNMDMWADILKIAPAFASE
ncbi:MAG: hypothetical protein ACTSWN_17285 [Promethearchaeota archaeon]